MSKIRFWNKKKKIMVGPHDEYNTKDLTFNNLAAAREGTDPNWVKMEYSLEKDVNGKDLCEGDIVECDGIDGKTFENESGKPEKRNIEVVKEADGTFKTLINPRVIGNRYKNTEIIIQDPTVRLAIVADR